MVSCLSSLSVAFLDLYDLVVDLPNAPKRLTAFLDVLLGQKLLDFGVITSAFDFAIGEVPEAEEILTSILDELQYRPM